MSPRWPSVALSQILRQNEDYVRLPEPRMYKKLSVKLYGKGVDLDTPADGASLKMQRHQIAKAGQVILSEIWGKKGAIGIVPREGDGALCTSHFFLFDLDQKAVDLGWLRAIFQANYLQPQLESQAKGTTGYAAVRPQHLMQATIPLPPLREQHRIVTWLESLTGRIEEARQWRRQAEDASTRVWRSAARQFFHSSVDHRSCQLGAVVTVVGGGTPTKDHLAYWSGKIPWFTPKDMKTRELIDSEEHISGEALAHSSAKLIEPGAVLVVVRGMILAHTVPAGVLRVRGTINQDMKALLPMEGLTAEYLNTTLWALNPEILALVERSTHDTRKLQTEKLLSLTIPIPELRMQHRIVERLEQIRLKVVELERWLRLEGLRMEALESSILSLALGAPLNSGRSPAATR